MKKGSKVIGVNMFFIPLDHEVPIGGIHAKGKKTAMLLKQSEKINIDLL